MATSVELCCGSLDRTGYKADETGHLHLCVFCPTGAQCHNQILASWSLSSQCASWLSGSLKVRSYNVG